MVDEGMIMRRDTRFSIRLMGLVTATLAMGLGSVAQAQTAQGTARIEVESFEASITSLRTQYAQMVRMSGRVLTFAAEPDTNPVAERWGHFVLYAPLNRLWLLDETDAVIEHAYIEVKQEPFDQLVLHWTQWRDVDIADVLPAAAQMPAFSVESTTPHPLAAAYDALLARPLAQAFEPLPAGAYFSAGGHVFDTTGAQIAEWDSFGPEIAMRLIPVEASSTTPAVKTKADAGNAAAAEIASDTQWHWFAVADLAAALNPKPPQGDQ